MAAYRQVLEPEHGNNSRQETHNHGAKRRQHHLARGSYGNAASQGSVLDVDLREKGNIGAETTSQLLNMLLPEYNEKKKKLILEIERASKRLERPTQRQRVQQ